MKEHESDVGQDLDAGWDAIEADVTSVSLKVKVAKESVEVTDLDAGWDFDEPRLQVGSPRQKENDRASKSDPKKANQTIAAVNESISAPALTKKARRELDRQNQIHASKRKSEAKALRKQQRLAKTPASAEILQSTAEPAQRAPAAKQNRNKKSKPKHRRSPEPALQPKSRTSAVSIHPENGQPTSDSRNVSAVEPQSSNMGNWRWWALGIALVVALWVAARLFFSSR